MKIKNTYKLTIGVLIFMILLFGTSYAFFASVVEKHGKLNIVVGTLDYQIKGNGITNNQVTLAAYEIKQITLSITSLNKISSKYELYYLPNHNVEVGYLEESQDPVSGNIDASQKKSVNIVVINHTNTSQTVTLGVEGGLEKNNLVLSKGNHISKLSPYKATNIIVNGGLEKENIEKYSSTMDIVRTNHLVYEGNYSLEAKKTCPSCSVNTSAGVVYYYLIQSIPKTIQNHKYYATEVIYPAKMNNSNSWRGEFDVFGSGTIEDGNIKLPNLKINTWQKLSFTFTSSAEQSLFRPMYINIPGSGDVDFQAYFDNMMFIDLTETFGSGNEPDQDWCDSHIHYFDDTITIYK